MKTFFAALVILLTLGTGALCPAQRRASGANKMPLAARAEYVGCWSDGGGARLSVTARRMRHGRSKWLRYSDVTERSDGKTYLLKTSGRGEFEFLSEVIALSLEGDAMRMTLYESMDDYSAGKQLGRNTYYKDTCGRVAGTRRTSSVGQVEFGAESAIERPIDIPYEVLRRLATDARFQRCYDDIELRSEKSSMLEWFSAAAVRLDADRLPDVIVKADHPCLLGASVAPFWVFRKAGHDDYDLVLQESALNLSVLRTRTNGLRDIRTQAASERELYISIWKFDGLSYKTKSTQGVTAKRVGVSTNTCSVC